MLVLLYSFPNILLLLLLRVYYWVDQSQSRVTILSSPDPFVWRVWWVVVVHQDTHENLEHARVTSTYNTIIYIYYDAHDNTDIDMLSYRHYTNTEREKERKSVTK